jgi:hypothetical protein
LTIMPNVTKTLDVFISKGEFYRPIFLNPTIVETFQVVDLLYNEDLWSQGSNDYLKINIRRDRRSVLYTSIEAGLIEWMIAVGGITSSLMSSLGITAGILSRYIFIAEIIKKLYMVKYTTNYDPSESAPKNVKWGFARTFTKNLQLGLTQDEDRHYQRLKQNIDEGKVTKKDMEQIVLNIYKSRGLLKQTLNHRQLFGLYFFNRIPKILAENFCCCLRKKGKGDFSRIVKHGTSRFFYELDVVNLMRTVRQSKLLFKT